MSKVTFPPLAAVTVSEYFLGSPPVEVDGVIALILTGALIFTEAKLVSAEHKTPAVTTIIAAKIRKLLKRLILNALKHTNTCYFLAYKDQPERYDSVTYLFASLLFVNLMFSPSHFRCLPVRRAMLPSRTISLKGPAQLNWQVAGRPPRMASAHSDHVPPRR
jgi:hypothetical protein